MHILNKIKMSHLMLPATLLEHKTSNKQFLSVKWYFNPERSASSYSSQ